MNTRLFLCAAWVLLAAARADAAGAAWQPLPKARNVIVLVPDGCSQSMVTLARWFCGAPLAVDQIQAGAVKTYSANNLVTDSAAAATAMACGRKTANGTISAAPLRDTPLLPEPPATPGQPLATVLEAARKSGRAVGLVVTCPIWEATPAAFAAHSLSRRADDEIVEQLVYQHLDVALGGGARLLSRPAPAGARHKDGETLRDVLTGRGYRVVETRATLAATTAGRVWGLFAPDYLTMDIDRGLSPQPSLAEMTAKALSLLSQDPDGFFLLVEGSLVDRADHANDPAAAVREFLAFDEAVRAALTFADGAGRGRTLVVACPDHDTGGMTIGTRRKTPVTVDDLVRPLARMRLSVPALAARIGTNDLSAGNIAGNVGAWWDMKLTDEEAGVVARRAEEKSLSLALVELLARRCPAVGWTTYSHTGVDVPLWSYGPGRPAGLVDNTDIGRVIAESLGADLDALTKTLFVDAQQAFPEARLDTADPDSPVLIVGAARLPVNTDLLLLNGQEHRLEGVVVHIAATGRTYLPQQAVDLIRASLRK